MTWQISLTIFINIVGWGIVHILSSQRDKKKEWREFARNTAKLVEEIAGWHLPALIPWCLLSDS